MKYITKAIQATYLFDNKKIDAQEWIAALLGDRYRDAYSDEYCRRAEKIFSIFVNNLVADDCDEDIDKEIIEELKQILDSIKSEKIKVQTANIEYNSNKRSEARADMFYETLSEAVSKLDPIPFNGIYIRDYPNSSEGVLCIADAHNGVEINMKSIFGEVVNTYNPDILRARLSKIISEMVSDKDRYLDYDKLTIFDLGDNIQGILRMSDLNKLKTGVIDSALDYANLISYWLAELSNQLEIPVEYICVGGNHDELRMLNGKHGDFESENMAKIIREIIYLRLKDNPNITVAEYGECAFKSIQGVNILAYHGADTKNAASELSFWENYNNIDIDILLLGHLHHKEESGVGYSALSDKEVIYVPSLVGADPFGKRCRKISRAGAKFMLFEDGAKTWERSYILN